MTTTAPDLAPAPTPTPRSYRWGAIAVAIALALGSLATTTWLGWWQWSRAHDLASVIAEAPAAPIAELVLPASSPSGAIGRIVTVEGAFGPGAAVVTDRAIDGVPATILVREFTVSDDASGTGEQATLAVVMGWRPSGESAIGEAPEGDVMLTGLVRSSEAPSLSPGDAGAANDGITGDGVTTLSALSAAELAQIWPQPLYSALVVSTEPEDGWQPLPQPQPERRLNLRSATYAAEWWLFGAFAAFVAIRWIRDNGRTAATERSDDD